MKQPYSITLKDGDLPSVTINAPALEASPRAWRTRLQWAWRCLRGRGVPVFPTVNIIGNRIESSDAHTPALLILKPGADVNVEDGYFLSGGDQA